MWHVEQRHQQAQKTALNPLECAASSVPGQVHPQPHNEQNHCWVLPAAQSAPLTGILLSRFFAHTCILPQFALLQSSPSHHCSCGYISTRTSFTEVTSLKWGICILLWAEDLCQQHKQEIFSVSWAGSFCWELQELISSRVYFNLGQVISTLQSFSFQTHLSAVDC